MQRKLSLREKLKNLGNQIKWNKQVDVNNRKKKRKNSPGGKKTKKPRKR